MRTESSVEILPCELAQIVESVFGTMMDLEVAEGWTLPEIPAWARMTSAVHLAGEWNGAVLIECDRQQACHFAGRFLSMDEPPEQVDDVVRDVLGELANMIGGNLKCIMTHGIRLSMPTVTEGGDGAMRICGSKICERLTFRCAEGLFGVTVLTTNLLTQLTTNLLTQA